MSRSHEHWVQDSILNPYICVAHNTPRVCTEILNKEFNIYNSVPKLANDWRWDKSLYGNQRGFNENFLSEYEQTSHCMIDQRINGFKRSKEKNIELENLCFDFASITKNNENFGNDKYIKNVEPILSKIMNNIGNDLPPSVHKALLEANNLLKKKEVKIDDVSKMLDFSSFFGREQCYLSLTNEQPSK